jgi:hypothetical protein
MFYGRLIYGQFNELRIKNKTKKKKTNKDCDDVIVRQEILVSAMTSATWNRAIEVCHNVFMYLEALVLCGIDNLVWPNSASGRTRSLSPLARAV